jgi:hypothetical protein
VYPTHKLEYGIPLIMNISSPVIQVFMIRYARHLSFSTRIIFWFTLESVMLAALPIAICYLTDTLYITMSLVFLFGFSTAVLQASLYGFAAMLPPIYTQAVMTGNGVAGLVVSVCRIFTKMSFPADDDGIRLGSLVYFCISAATTFLCVVFYIVLLRMPFTRYYIQPHKSMSPDAIARREKRRVARQKRKQQRAAHRLAQSRSKEVRPLLTAFGSGASDYGGMSDYTAGGGDSTAAYGMTSDNTTAGGSGMSRLSMPSSAFHKCLASTSLTRQARRNVKKSVLPDLERTSYVDILGAMYPLALVVCGIFTVTFAIFPALMTSIPSELMSQSWFAILLIFEFNVFDLIGRSAPQWYMLSTPTTIWIPSLLRVLLFPAFLLCVHPRVFTWSLAPLVLTAVFAASNGYFASLAMMFAPQTVDDEDKESAGSIMSLCLNLGILLGSTIALLLHNYALV